MDAIVEYIINQYPYFLITIVVGIVVFLACRYHYSNVAPTKKVAEELNGRMDNLPCEQHKDDISKFKNVFESIEEMKGTMAEVAKWISHSDNSMIDVFMKKYSPYRLTKVGESILEDSGAKQIVDDNTDFFLTKIDELNPMTPYDVENYAMDVILKSVNNEMFNGLKDYVYYSPDKKLVSVGDENVEVKIFMPWILRSLSIYLRDKYFEAHPGIEDHKGWQFAMLKGEK